MKVETIGVTGLVTQINWLPGSGSEKGSCDPDPIQGYPCVASPCTFGAFKVVVTGNGKMRWKNEASGEWEPEQRVEGTVERIFGSAANPVEVACGDGISVVTFPDDLAGVIAKCSECN